MVKPKTTTSKGVTETAQSQTQQPQTAQTQSQPKPAEKTTTNNSTDNGKLETQKQQPDYTVEKRFDRESGSYIETTRYRDGDVYERFYSDNSYRNPTKVISTNANGKRMIRSHEKDNLLGTSKITEYYEPGYMDGYPKGMYKEITFEKGLRKEVCTDGDNLATRWYNRKGDLIKEDLSAPNKDGRIKFEELEHGWQEVYADGRTLQHISHGNGYYDDIITYADGTKKIKSGYFMIQF